jgi:hypothetical protein
MKGIEDYVREVVGKVGHVQPPAKSPIVAPVVPAQTRDASPEPASRPGASNRRWGVPGPIAMTLGVSAD